MKLVPKGVTRSVGRKVLVVKKNSPHIFFVGGVAGVIGATFLACRATLKLEKTLDEIKDDLDAVKPEVLVDNLATQPPVQTQAQVKAVGLVTVRSTVKLGRLYGPSILLGGASIAALTGSHVQLTRRNAALTATLAAVTRAYDEYRIRVQEEIGKERELDIYRNIKEEEIEVDGKKKKVKVTDPSGWSPYARFFDEASPNWQKNPEMNRIFLECQQNYANHLLRSRGHVFLNEVYDSLGLERSKAGQVVGWVSDGDGDGYIDFGLYEAVSKDFVTGMEPRIVLDFNVDGVVYDALEDNEPRFINHELLEGGCP